MRSPPCLTAVSVLLGLIFGACAFGADPDVGEDLRRLRGAGWGCSLVFGMEDKDIVRIDYEYALGFYGKFHPVVDGESVRWEKIKEGVDDVEITILAHREGREIIEIVYILPQADPAVPKMAKVMLCLQTSEGYSRPFYIAEVEGTRYGPASLISTQKHPLMVTTSLSWSGTGAMRAYYQFDVSGPRPRFLRVAGFGRIQENDPDKHREAYEKREREERQIMTGK